MTSTLVMIFTHFVTVCRLLTVFRKGYATLCKWYPAFRSELAKAVHDPNQDWDDKLMSTMDKLFKHK